VPAVILDKPVERAALSGLFADFGRIADVVGYCVDQRRRCGFGCFKYKSTGVSAEWDIRLLRAMREGLGGEIRIRWDPNAAYSPAQAATIAGQLDDLGLEFFEDPTGGTPGMAAVRARVRTPLATNMCVTQFDHLPDALHRHGVDVLLADIYMWGGVQSLVELADVAGLLGFDMAIHSLFETGIGTAANLHMASAFANVRRATDFGLHVLEEEMTQPPLLPVVDGRIAVPDGPGLGVMPDPEATGRRLVGEAIVIES
jgi:glucarate dehydratase